MTHFSMLREKHWHCSQLNQALMNRVGLPTNIPLAEGYCVFWSCVHQRVATNTAIAAQIMTIWF